MFLLREVFDYDYDTIAGVVARNPANCRQILARARAHVRENRPRFEVSPARRDELARRFFSACHGGDLAALESLLADDVTFYADGNGRPPAVVAPVVGCTPVARFLLGLFRHADRTGLEVQPRAVNGQPGARVLDGRGRLRAVFALHIADGAIRAVHTVVNPDKLRHLHGR